MSLIRRLFGRGQPLRLSREAEAAFRKIELFLTDDDAQNALLPLDVRQTLENAANVDEIENALGDFGRELTNPIPVNGPIGEVTYLSSVTINDAFVFSHRIGSIEKIDVFEVVAFDGSHWDLLFFDPYHPRKSRMLPRGYCFRSDDKPPMICSTNQRIQDFPSSMAEAISSWTKDTLGLSLVSPEIRLALRETRFVRPAEHAARLEKQQIAGHTSETPNVRGILLRNHTEKAIERVQGMLLKLVSRESVNHVEIVYFCSSVAVYCYLHFGEDSPNRRLVEEFNRNTVSGVEKQSLSFSEAVSHYQIRYREYSVLLDRFFSELSADDVTPLSASATMAICGIDVSGRPLIGAVAGAAVTAVISDSIVMAKRLRRPRVPGIIESSKM